MNDNASESSHVKNTADRESTLPRPRSDAAGWFAAGVLGVAIAALYWPAVARGEFLADDWWFVSHYSLSRWLATFRGDWILGQWGTGAYYRPLIAGSMMLDDFLFGIWRPGGWHAVNLVIHWANAWLLFAIARRALAPSFLPALLGALFFALYPRFPEAVYWISGRTVLLVMTFVLATVWFFMKEEESKAAQPSTPALMRWRWSYLTTALACLTTETSLTIPLILTAIVMFHTPQTGPRRNRRVNLTDDLKQDWRALRANLVPAARRLAPYYAIILVYFAWRWAALGGPGGYPEQKAGLLSLRALATPLSHYVYALMNPARYHVPPDLFWPVAGWVVALGLAVIAARRRMPRGLALGVWWMIVALGPYINLALVDEERGRFLYPAAAGFFLAAAAAGSAAGRWIALHSRPAAVALTAIIVLGIGGLYVKTLREQIGYWDEASRTSRRIIDTVLEKYPAPPQGKPMIFAHVDMDPTRKTSLHAIRGALLYPTPMLPTPFGKIYGAKGTPLEAWGWGMIPDGAPPPGSPFVLIDRENQVTIYETGESAAREFDAKAIWELWSRSGEMRLHVDPTSGQSFISASNVSPANPDISKGYYRSQTYTLINEIPCWMSVNLVYDTIGEGNRISMSGIDHSFENAIDDREFPRPETINNSKQALFLEHRLQPSETIVRERIPFGYFEGACEFILMYWPRKDGEIRLYKLGIFSSPLYLTTDEQESQNR